MDTTHNLLSRQEHDQQNVEKGKKKLDTVVITIRRCSSQEMKPTKKEMKRKMNVSCLCVYLMLSYIIGIICKAKHLLLFFDYINCVRLHLCVWTYSHTHTQSFTRSLRYFWFIITSVWWRQAICQIVIHLCVCSPIRQEISLVLLCLLD